MKNKAEKLYLYLSETDDDILREAEKTDTRDKLFPENAPVQVPIQRKPRRFTLWKAASAVAACAAFAFLLNLFLPFVGNVRPKPSPEVIKIDSLDAINYYGVKMLSARNAASAPANQNISFTGYRKSGTKSGEAPVFFTSETTSETSDDLIKYDEEKGYYYYEFDPSDSFTILGACGFSIRLSDPNGFLAQKLGTGLIDVVLTSNSFEDMITFRSQDGKYFSCLSGDFKEGYLQYGDNKFVDGFRVAKRMIQSGETNGYTFSVKLENGIPVGFENSYYFEQIGNELPLDDAEFVEGSGYYVESEESFTVAELEEFANNFQKSN